MYLRLWCGNPSSDTAATPGPCGPATPLSLSLALAVPRSFLLHLPTKFSLLSPSAQSSSLFLSPPACSCSSICVSTTYYRLVLIFLPNRSHSVHIFVPLLYSASFRLCQLSLLAPRHHSASVCSLFSFLLLLPDHTLLVLVPPLPAS